MALLLLLAAQAPIAPPASNWDALGIFPLPRAAIVSDSGADFVHGEVDAGRCAAIATDPHGTRLTAPVAILVGPGGLVRQIVPRAINCPTVEQYTVGYVLSLTRGGPGTAATPAPGWYRLTVTYRW